MPVIQFRDIRETKRLQMMEEANAGFRENIERLSEAMLIVADHGVQNLTDHEMADITGSLIPLMQTLRRIEIRLNGSNAV